MENRNTFLDVRPLRLRVLNSPWLSIVSRRPRKLGIVPSSATRNNEMIALVALSSVTT